MTKGQQPRQSRARTHFKFYSEQFLFGSTRSELDPDERAVWVDFLCLASLNLGDVECYSRDQLAHQLYIEQELLDRSIEKFISYGKVNREYLEEERREIFHITKWNQYQADYLKKRIARSKTPDEENRIENPQEFDAENQPILKGRIGEENTLQNTRSEENKELASEDNDPFEDPFSPDPPDPFMQYPDPASNFQEEHNDPFSDDFPDQSSKPSLHYPDAQSRIQEELLSMLCELDNYPYNSQIDVDFVSDMMRRYPGIDFVAETKKKIAWWEQNPGAIRNNPRQQLNDWFQKEFEFQQRRRQ